jgi:beta-lactam-binding protein with PASTA domain/tRNA A-37 threonylcarbamoyl transferase component Bud32
MAEVYRARDLRLGRVVAVKALREDLARDQAFRARFRREAQSAASLNHPSIVAVYDTGEDVAGDTAVPYIVMEYVDGATLHDLVRGGRRLLPQRALEIVDSVLGALDHSHRTGIVHRDIKPANVMLTAPGAVKVMDFGIARALSASQVTITQAAQVIGTAQYLSPEQARAERVDARSDLYSTGCLLYELFTGQPPFTGDSPAAIAYQHVRENPVPPSQADPGVPRWADAIVLKAMAKNPADRYQTAADMRAGIQQATAGMHVSAPPAQMLPPPTQWIGGQSIPAATAPAPAGDDHGRGPEPLGGGSRRRAWPWVLLAAVVLALSAGAFHVLAAGGAKSYAVPDVRGLTEQQARSTIAGNHLRPQFLSQDSRSVPGGHVITTDPGWGTMLPAGSVVHVFVSAGSTPPASPATAPAIPASSPPLQRVSVPDVVGDDASAAQAKLASAGLNPVTRPDPAATAAAGTVARQNPAGGAKVDPDSTVIIYVSGIKVPDVTGDTAGTATGMLQGQGFQVNEVDQAGQPGIAAGEVYRQNPPGGTLVAYGATVTIYVQPAAPGQARSSNEAGQHR